MCASPLLKKSLERFLEGHVTSYKDCDFVLADQVLEIEKPYLLIADSHEADIKKPFSRSQLMVILERYYKRLRQEPITVGEQRYDLSLQELKREIRKATESYLDEIESLIDTYGQNAP
mgnify:CR=1 FL=1